MFIKYCLLNCYGCRKKVKSKDGNHIERHLLKIMTIIFSRTIFTVEGGMAAVFTEHSTADREVSGSNPDVPLH